MQRVTLGECVFIISDVNYTLSREQLICDRCFVVCEPSLTLLQSQLARVFSLPNRAAPAFMVGAGLILCECRSSYVSIECNCKSKS